MTGRQVARMLEGQASQRGVLNALNDLTREGLVIREDAPPSALFSLNRQHLAADAIEHITDIRQKLLTHITNRIETWAIQPTWAAIFGSTARGDGTSESDIDLMILHADHINTDEDTWYSQVTTLATDIQAWSGNEADILEYSHSEIKDLQKQRSALIKSLKQHSMAQIQTRKPYCC